MPKYYCDYCDAFLTHDSPSVRKTHNGGRKHKENVRHYYQSWMESQAQKLIDATTKAFTTQRMVGAPPPGVIPPQVAAMGMMPRPYGIPSLGMMRPPTLARGLPPVPVGAGFFIPPMPTGLPANIPMTTTTSVANLPMPPVSLPPTTTTENGSPAIRTNIKMQPPE